MKKAVYLLHYCFILANIFAVLAGVLGEYGITPKYEDWLLHVGTLIYAAFITSEVDWLRQDIRNVR